MEAPVLSPAKVILLAVQLATDANVSGLRTLIAQQQKVLRTGIVLRILLTYLPETIASSDYVPILQGLVSGDVPKTPNSTIESSSLHELTEKQAARKVKKLHLLPLAWSNSLADVPDDPLVLFLIHRSLRIDESAGLITEIPKLLSPFLHKSSYLKIWLISNVLPLLRLSYEYHPKTTTLTSISSFERLDNEVGITLLLSETKPETGQKGVVGRDLRGLVGPWMYGDSRLKRRRLRKSSPLNAERITPLDEAPIASERYGCWEDVFRWITEQAQGITSWATAVQAIDQWDGPGDVDLGGYEDGTEWLDEDDQQYLERRYARSALAAAYLIPEASVDALVGVHQILCRIIVFLDLDRIPTLEASGALLIPVEGLDNMYSRKDAAFLRNGLLDEVNTLTKPHEMSLKFLHAVLISAYLMTKEGSSMTVRRAAELALRQDEADQMSEFRSLLLFDEGRPGNRGDDKFWIRIRNGVLWLRSWGSEELVENGDARSGRGIFGKLSCQVIEIAVLKGLLSNNRLSLAQSIYEKSSDPPLSKQVLHDIVLSAAMEAYDNATNPNKSRGGVKKCRDILNAFPGTFEGSNQASQAQHLIDLTDQIGQYRIVFKKGEPFTPVLLRINDDPISIFSKILDQNPKSYTRVNDFIHMSRKMVEAGLTSRSKNRNSNLIGKLDLEEENIAEKRVTCMCIDAALNDDDFETAYSYVMSRLEVLAGPAQSRTADSGSGGSGLAAERPPTILDDWSWKAALQAGKYRRNQHTIKPTHLGNASSNLEIRHLQQRMDCLSLALRCGPPSALQEILNTFRRCEEELDTQVKQEEENEAAWDAQADDQVMPGGFTTSNGNEIVRGSSMPAEEAPISLFELSRAGMARAQSGLSALSRLQVTKNNAQLGESGATETAAQRTRKRDQLKNAAVGTLASGVGWLIGAPAPPSDREDSS